MISVAKKNPGLASEWSPINSFAPNEVTVGSSKKVAWTCGKCGHEWEASIFNRCHGKWTGCRMCAKANA